MTMHATCVAGGTRMSTFEVSIILLQPTVKAAATAKLVHHVSFL